MSKLSLGDCRGRHRYPECHPEDYSAERLSEGHVGIRFGDRELADLEWHITLDGKDATPWCTEALAGPHGWVEFISTSQPGVAGTDTSQPDWRKWLAHVCSCGGSVCRVRVHGDVTVSRRRRAMPAA